MKGAFRIISARVPFYGGVRRMLCRSMNARFDAETKSIATYSTRSYLRTSKDTGECGTYFLEIASK